MCVSFLLQSGIVFLFSFQILASEIRPASDYLILLKEVAENFKSKNIEVESGVYETPRDLVKIRGDVRFLVGGSIWNAPSNWPEPFREYAIEIGYPPGFIENTRNEIWAVYQGKYFLLKDQNGVSQKLSPVVPRQVFPAKDGLFIVLMPNKTEKRFAFLNDDTKNQSSKGKFFDQAPAFNDVQYYSLTQDGRGIIYLSTDFRVVTLRQDGEQIEIVKLDKPTPDVSILSDGVQVKSGENDILFTKLTDQGMVESKKIIFTKKEEETLLFKNNLTYLETVFSKGGSARFLVNAKGELDRPPAILEGGKLQASDKLEVLKSLSDYGGEDWLFQAKRGKFNSIVDREREVELALDPLKSGQNTWVNVIGPHGVGTSELLKSIAKKVLQSHAEKGKWSEYEVLYFPLSALIKLAGLDVASEKDDSSKDKTKLELLNKVLLTVKKKKAILLIQDFLNDPALGPTNAGTALDLFLRFFRQSIENGEIKVVTTSDSEIWDQVKNYALQSIQTTVLLSEPTDTLLEEMLRVKISEYQSRYHVRLDPECAQWCPQYSCDLYPSDVEPRRSYRALEALSSHFANEKSDLYHCINQNEAKRYYMSLLYGLDLFEKIDFEKFESFLNCAKAGQTEAFQSLISHLSVLRSGLSIKNKPLSTLFFLTPTGYSPLAIVNLISEYLKIPFLVFDGSQLQGQDFGKENMNKIKELGNQPFILFIDGLYRGNHPQKTFSDLRSLLATGVFRQGTPSELKIKNAILVLSTDLYSEVILNHSQDSSASIIKEISRTVENTAKESKPSDTDKIPLDIWGLLEQSAVVFKPLCNGDLQKEAHSKWNQIKSELEIEFHIEIIVGNSFVNYLLSDCDEENINDLFLENKIETLFSQNIRNYLLKLQFQDIEKFRKINKIFITRSSSGENVIVDSTDLRFDEAIKNGGGQ